MDQRLAPMTMMHMKTIILSLLCLTMGALPLHISYSNSPKESPAAMELNLLAEKFANSSKKAFRHATTGELASLKKLNLPESVIDFYKTHVPTGDNVEGPLGIRLLSVKAMIEENSGSHPGKDVLPLGFVVFATVDGDAFCYDLKGPKSPDGPRIVLFGHEEPFEGISREDLLETKAKISAVSLKEFLKKALAESIDVDPKY